MKVKIDINNNRLYIKPIGRVTKNELDKTYTEIRFGVEDLHNGFSLIADYTDCTIGDISAIPTFRKIIAYLTSKGLAEVIRVLPEDSLVFKQALRFSTMFQGYKPTYVKTLKEAEELLEKGSKRKGLRFILPDSTIDYYLEDCKYKGCIKDISISGCLIEAKERLPPVGELVELSINISYKNSLDDFFTIKSVVVRSDTESFAVKFSDFKEGEDSKLFEAILYQLQSK